MIDREKVVKALELCRWDECKKCQYHEQSDCFEELLADARALLKEYAEMEKTYSQVLMETTGNLLSKTNYTLTAIMDCIREHYCDGCDIREELDALLKAQEPVKPLKMEVDHVRKEPVVFSYECPVCMTGLQRHWVACPNCGMAVKWDD